MWGVHGDTAFLAEEAGASRVVVYDAMDPTPEFDKRHGESGSRIRYVQGDLHDPESVGELGVFDVVWCAGVIYHSPNPYLLLEHLREMTGERLVLGTHVIPEIPGFEGACIWYPALSDSTRKAFAWAHGDVAPNLLGLATPFDATPGWGYVNFWWGITRSALRSMLDLARFEVVEEFMPHPFFVDVLVAPITGDSLIPSPGFARQRGRDRHPALPEDPARDSA
jgi:methyltransferase family protein